MARDSVEKSIDTIMIIASIAALVGLLYFVIASFDSLNAMQDYVERSRQKCQDMGGDFTPINSKKGIAACIKNDTVVEWIH